MKRPARKVAELVAQLAAAPAGRKDAIRQEIRIERANIALRISQATLRGGDALKQVLKGVLSVVVRVLESKLTSLIAG